MKLGTSNRRTMVASIRIAAEIPQQISWVWGDDEKIPVAKTPRRIRAAPVMSEPLRERPSTTAASRSCDRA
ncbi:hypothetical protein D3C87_1977590 [compost metagenome]